MTLKYQKTNIFALVILILLALSISFSPEFNLYGLSGGKLVTAAGPRNIVIRLEDLLLALFGLLWIAHFFISGKNKIKKPPLFLPILCFLLISLVSVMTNILLGNVYPLRAYLYLFKEIEFFFLYFYVYSHLTNIKTAGRLIQVWWLIGVTAFLLIICQMLADFKFGFYGPGLPFERGPLPNGGWFLMLFVFLFNYFLYAAHRLMSSKKHKILVGLSIITITTGIVASCSRASVVGLIIAVTFSLILYGLKTKRRWLVLAYGLAIFGILAGILLISAPQLPHVSRLLGITHIYQAMIPRIGVWKDYLLLFPFDNFLNILVGLGKSAVDESHNQYLRSFIDVGLLGLTARLILIGVIVKQTAQAFFKNADPMIIGVAAGSLVNTVALIFIGITAEVFLVVKIMMIYWFLMAITMFLIKQQSDPKQSNDELNRPTHLDI